MSWRFSSFIQHLSLFLFAYYRLISLCFSQFGEPLLLLVFFGAANFCPPLSIFSQKKLEKGTVQKKNTRKFTVIAFSWSNIARRDKRGTHNFGWSQWMPGLNGERRIQWELNILFRGTMLQTFTLLCKQFPVERRYWIHFTVLMMVSGIPTFINYGTLTKELAALLKALKFNRRTISERLESTLVH